MENKADNVCTKCPKYHVKAWKQCPKCSRVFSPADDFSRTVEQFLNAPVSDTKLDSKIIIVDKAHVEGGENATVKIANPAILSTLFIMGNVLHNYQLRHLIRDMIAKGMRDPVVLANEHAGAPTSALPYTLNPEAQKIMDKLLQNVCYDIYYVQGSIHTWREIVTDLHPGVETIFHIDPDMIFQERLRLGPITYRKQGNKYSHIAGLYYIRKSFSAFSAFDLKMPVLEALTIALGMPVPHEN